MAAAPDHEGKVIASAADICGACEDHLAVKHCTVCPVNLCAICAKAHKKLKISSNHSLTDIGANSKPQISRARSGTCTKHEQQPFTILCKDCVQLGCDSCKTQHSGHSLQPLNDDPKLCQRVCGKHIQHLIDDLHEIEEIKSVLEGQIITYDEAINVVDQWEVDLLMLIKENASKLRKQLKELKDKKYKQIKDQVNGLMTRLKDIDRSIAILNETRKSMDFSILSNELSKSKELIERLESYKDEMKPLPEPISVDDVLPHKDRLKDAEADLKDIFRTGQNCYPQKGPAPAAEWRFTEASNGRDISTHGKNRVTMKNIQYGPGPNGEKDGAAILPTSADQSMIVMNPSTNLRFNKGMTFFAHIFLDNSKEDGFLFLYDTGVTNGLDAFVHLCSNQTRIILCSGPRVTRPVSLTPLTWHKIAIVIDTSSVSLYVNGKLVLSHYIKMDLSHTLKGNIHFGQRPGYNDRLRGRLACCKFFDKALDLNDIQRL